MPQLPKKFEAIKKHRAHVRWAAVAVGLLVLASDCRGVTFSFAPTDPARSSALPSKKASRCLPFENLSSDKENAFFTDGVQDEILTDLAKIADLKVISRTSVMQYKSGVATQSARDRPATRRRACGGRQCATRRPTKCG